MNVRIDRDSVIHFVLALAICLGGWMFFTKPRLVELRKLEGQIAKGRASVAAVDQETVERIATQTTKLSARVAEIKARGGTASDSSQLYGAISSLARDHGVLVPSLDPGSAPRPDENVPVAATRINLTVEGRYEAVAAFLQTMEGIAGFVRPVSLNLTPFETDGQPMVRGRYVCEAVSFYVPDALTKIEEGIDVE